MPGAGRIEQGAKRKEHGAGIKMLVASFRKGFWVGGNVSQIWLSAAHLPEGF
jgi:hypothetical protein